MESQVHISVTAEDLNAAQLFFMSEDENALAAQCVKINQHQPCFTDVMRSLEMQGLPIEQVEDLLEAVFVVYYAYTEVNRLSLKTISMMEVINQVELYVIFINNYNRLKQVGHKSIDDLMFLSNPAVVEFAASKLKDIYRVTANIPREASVSFFALLKAIEVEVEAIGSSAS